MLFRSWQDLDLGKVGVTDGPWMAAVDEFEVTLHGRGAHGAQPDQGLDPVVAMAHVVTALQTIANDDAVVKVSVRDLAPLAARGGHGATTVAATSHLAALAGIRVFATGGLGGVHRLARETWDESADLTTLGTTRMTVVCAGVKSILDVGATLERLETLNVTVIGYRTHR